MIFLIKKHFNSISENKKLTAILTTFAFLFGFLLDKIVFSPDEYFYTTLGRSFAAAYNGGGCLYCIDTAHTSLLPFLISLGYYFFSIDSIVFYRIITSIFAVLTLYVLFKISQISYADKKDAFIFFAIMLLFPGFFTFAGKVNLGTLALFFSAVVIYLLLKRETYWKISLALALVFLSKDYYVLFSAFVIFSIIIIDALKEQKNNLAGVTKKIGVNLFVAFLPLLFLVVFFITFPIFPYSRMLDNMFLEIFGRWYVYVGQEVHNIFGLLENNAQISNVNLILKGIKDATLQSDAVNNFNGIYFWEKIRAIYESSYKEIDMNILVLPLVIIGLASRIRNIYLSFRHEYDLARKDLIMLLFLVIFSFLNYRIASGSHGFRIIFPLLIPYSYLIYWATRSIFEKDGYWSKFFFAVFSFLAIFIYFESSHGNLIYSSLLSKFYLVSIFLRYKIYVNVFIYASLATVLLFYGKLRMRRKNMAIVAILVLLFLYKILPYVVDKHLSDMAYGNDSNLILARPYLEKIEMNKAIVLTNVKSYPYYYYANSTTMPNVARKDLPIVRKKPRIVYPNRIISLGSLDFLKDNFLCHNKVDYIFYLHADNREGLPVYFSRNVQYLTPVVEYKVPETGKLNWILYEVNNTSCK